MIVTCPGCSSKYRVRNEVVPADGARMRCPKCETLFLAKPPTGPDAQNQLQEEPSSMFVQLNPSTTATGPHAIRNLQQAGTPPQHTPQPPPSTQTFGAPQQAFGAPQQAFGAPQQAFGAPQQPFGAPQQPFGAPQQSFAGAPTSSPFGAPQQPFGATPQPPPFGAQPPQLGAPQPFAQGFPSSTPTQQAFGAPQPFAPPQQQQFGAPQPFPQQQQQPSQFGTPQPFAQPPAGPFGASTQSFTAPSSQPVPPQTQSFTQQPAPQAKPQSGPITALFQAFDPGALPAEAQRPPAPQQAQAGGDAFSGLTLDDAPKVKLTAPSTGGGDRPLTRPSATVPASLRKPMAPAASAPGVGGVVASWAALAVAVIVFAGGVVLTLWTTESANLDGALLPVAEHTFGRAPPRSTVTKPEELEELRAQATQAMSAGDLPRAVVLWRRVKARAPDDPRAAQLIAKCLSDLGDLEGAT